MSWSNRLRRFHRFQALAMSAIVLMAAGSGLLHVVMARTQAPPPRPLPQLPIPVAQLQVPLSAILADLPASAGEVVAIDLRPIGDEAWWQIRCTGLAQPIWRSARDGRPDAEAEVRYAAQIAERHLGGVVVEPAGYLTTFSAEYGPIFRVLPVHRFTVDDGRGTRLFVSTVTGSVTRLTDDQKQFESTVFSLLHKWTFIPHRGLRDAVIVIAMLGLMLLAVTGIWLFMGTRRRRTEPAIP